MENFDCFESNKTVVIKMKRLNQYQSGIILFDDDVDVDLTDPDNPVYGPFPDHIKKYYVDLAAYTAEQMKNGIVCLYLTPEQTETDYHTTDIVGDVTTNVDFSDVNNVTPIIVAANYDIGLQISSDDDDNDRYAIVIISK